MQTYYDYMLKDESTALDFPSSKNGAGGQKLLASMPDHQAPDEWELHTLENLIWNDNHQWVIKSCSRDITTCMRWLIRQLAYPKLPVYATQC
jgi:hypothetical protein